MGKAKVIFLALILSGCVHSALPISMGTCETSMKRQRDISDELIKILKDDQADRSIPFR